MIGKLQGLDMLHGRLPQLLVNLGLEGLSGGTGVPLLAHALHGGS